MKTQPNLAALLVMAALAGLSGCETPPVRGDVRVHDRDVDLRIVFSDHDRRILRDYYRVDYRTLPPGLAKQGKVPPGHAHRIMVRQPLPPGLDWGYLPSRLERQLSPLPDGYVRVIVGGSVAIMNVRTRVIFDLIENIHD